MNCKNCGADFDGNYCSQCGQKSGIEALQMSSLLSEALAVFFYLERRFIYTFKQIFIAPYDLVKSYSYGARRKHANPFQFFLFFLTIYLVLYSIFGDDLFKSLGVEMNVDGKKMESATEVLSLKETLDRYMNYLYILQPIFLALSLKLFFSKKLNLAEALVTAFYLESINLLIGILMMLPTVHYDLYAVRSLLGVSVYVMALSRFSDNKLLGAFKGLLSGILSIILFGGVIASIIAFFISSK